MIQPDVSVLLPDPGLSGMPSLSNADHTIFSEKAPSASWFQAKVILDSLKETGNLLRQETYSFDVMSH